MSADPGYGETPLEPEETDALTPQAREAFGSSPRKLDLYQAEQAIADEVSIRLLATLADGVLSLEDLLTDTFLRDLHRQLYTEIWTWAGRYRTTEKSIGIDPAGISTEIRMSLDTIRYRWSQTRDWTARELGIAVHPETVRIHPFVDGNGRSTRLLADLVFFAAQDPEAQLENYDWGIEKETYIALLRDYDRSRDPKALEAFIPVHRVDESLGD